MGGRGSGRRDKCNTKPLVEHCTRLDIRDLKKRGVKSATLARSSLTMKYEIRNLQGVLEKISQPLPLTWTPCHFGGRRPWFVCRCGRRVAVLHLAEKHYLCRHCCGLAYTSQNENRAHRALRRANKIRERLRGLPGPAKPLPPKPKGMHRATYWRLAISHYVSLRESLERLAARYSSSYRRFNAWKRGTGNALRTAVANSLIPGLLSRGEITAAAADLMRRWLESSKGRTP